MDKINSKGELTLRTKIFLGFSSMLILILSLCVVSIEYLVNIRHEAGIAARHTEIAGLSYDIEIALLEARRAEKNHILRGGSGYLVLFKDKTAKIRDRAGRVKKLDFEGEFTDQITKIEHYTGEYEKAFLLAARSGGLISQKSGEVGYIDAARKLQELVYPIVETAKEKQKRAMLWSEETKKQAISAIILFGVAIIITAVLMTYYIPKQVTRSVDGLIATMKKIEGGDLTARAGVSSGDEIELLGGYFNNMLDGLVESKRRAAAAEKLASLGTLSAGIAHEINNPLTGILTSAHLVLKALPKKSKSRDDLKIIISETMRCRDIVSGLLEFSRAAKAKIGPVDVNPVLDKALLLVKNQAGSFGVTIINERGNGLPGALADANRLEQVALNVLLNSIEAMPGGGTLKVRTFLEKNTVCVEISDTGRGIPRANLDRIFDPFFTTKEAGKGTGLGLAVSYGIIKEFKGNIEVSSTEGSGTTVLIELPSTRRGG